MDLLRNREREFSFNASFFPAFEQKQGQGTKKKKHNVTYSRKLFDEEEEDEIEAPLKGLQHPDISPGGEESESTSPCSVINRWRNRDHVFAGLYRQGITPKKPFKKQVREASIEGQLEDSEELKPRQNPFVVITPQIFRKKPFHSHSPSSEDVNSPTNGTPKKASTPNEGKVNSFLFEKTRENQTPRKRSAFWRQDRGKRF